MWAHNTDGDSPTALTRLETGGTQPTQLLLKARALNQTAVDCSWTGPQAQVHTRKHTHTFSHTIFVRTLPDIPILEGKFSLH